MQNSDFTKWMEELMGIKKYKPKANEVLLGKLAETYWKSCVAPVIRDNGHVSRAHAVWSMSQSGCKVRDAQQLVRWQVTRGSYFLYCVGKTWMIFPRSAMSRAAQPASGGK